ncbi:type IVB secretion system protein IcmH/DotU [Rhodobacteraceae bacterium]|nr:type IVB secretion system protein IcmH/DotU [Paracoccaceae bacterium]
MTKDDPFGLENDAGRTRIRPVNRPRQVLTGHAGSQDVARVDHAPARIQQARAGDNPLVSAFSVLLGLAPELERATEPESADVLNSRFHDNLVFSRDTAVSSGVVGARADQAAWFVAATLDDIVLNTPWGARSSWPRQPLVTQMSGDVDAGEQFFERLDELLRFPDRDPHMLELAYYCLSLGFRGRHRVQGASGEAALTQLRDRIARQFTQTDPPELSPRWKGVDAPDQPPKFAIPIWTLPLMGFALLAAVYVGLGTQLSAKGENLYSLAALLPPPERSEIYRPPMDTTNTEEIKIEEPVLIELLPLFAEAASADTVQALTGREDPSLAIIVVQANAPEVFRSAKADLNGVYSPLIGSIASVIIENIELIGGVTVVGHTDSIPVQRSNPFQSNQGLSEARARTISNMLASAGVPQDLIAFEGRASAQPLADNATREGRARNRRIEIIIDKKF